jgi:hypothetical protein
MENDLLEGTKQNAEVILVPIVDHLNRQFDWRSVMKLQATFASVGRQFSFEDLKRQEGLIGAHLTEYVESWIAAECDFGEWSKTRPELYSRLHESLRDIDLVILPDKPNGGRMLPIASRPSKIQPGHREAAWLFAKFITSPFYDRIGQCPYCSRYFFSIRGGDKKYCSRTCATGFTARQAVKARRAEAQQEKINRAQAAITKYESLMGRDEDWKEWVKKKAKVSRNWLTRAVERGDLHITTKKEGGNEDDL